MAWAPTMQTRRNDARCPAGRGLVLGLRLGGIVFRGPGRLVVVDRAACAATAGAVNA
jgi:hypothetical protein